MALVTGGRVLAGHAFQQSPLWDALTLGLGAVGGWFGVTGIPHLWRMARSGVRQDRAQMAQILTTLEAVRDESSGSAKPSRPPVIDLDIFVRFARVAFQRQVNNNGYWQVQLEGFAITNRAPEGGKIIARIEFYIEGANGSGTSHFLNANDRNHHPFAGDVLHLHGGECQSADVNVGWYGPILDCEKDGKFEIIVRDTLTDQEATQEIQTHWEVPE